jgi:acyl carrier protein
MPDDSGVWERVVRIIRATFDDPKAPIGRETTARDVRGWDSVANIELLVTLEAEFGVRFYTGQIAGLRNVGELVDAIEARLIERGRPRP